MMDDGGREALRKLSLFLISYKMVVGCLVGDGGGDNGVQGI